MLNPSVIEMKEVLCSFGGCSGRRIHHEHPDIMRPHQKFWVPMSHPGPWWCSLECMAYGHAAEKEKDPPPE